MTPSWKQRLTAMAGAAAVLSAVPALATARPDDTSRSTSMTMHDDLANRSPEIHWPAGFDPDRADLFSHNAALLHAPCEKVWGHIVDATGWPAWYPNARDVRIVAGGVDGRLGQGTVFRWQTFGLPLESRVNEFVPYSRIGWYGYAPGAEPTFYHTWYLVPEGDGCRVVTDEVGKGKDAAQLRRTDEGLMHRGHDLWLATLKWVSEGK